MITTTDKTEIEIEAHVSKYILYYIYLYILQYIFFKLQKYNFLLIILKKDIIQF